MLAYVIRMLYICIIQTYKCKVMAKVQLPVRTEQAHLDKLKEFAKESNRSLSNYVDTLFKTHIAEKEKKVINN